MLVKSIRATSHIADLRETFETLRSHKMKLNPAKCAFGVSYGKFLGFMVLQRGIEANPEKVSAVLSMQSPQTTKQLQKLIEKITTLNRFISRSTDKCLPFFKILRKAFEWNRECNEAFGKLKEYLVNPPLLSRPDEGEILYLYLAVSPSVVSSALVREDSGIQKPVYFTSKALHGAKERYPWIEKLAFTLIVLARRLRPYFQAHAIRVLTEYPMKKILQKPDLSGKLVNWSVELGQFDIELHPRTSIKGQVLADFLLEFNNTPESEELPKKETWVVYVDGSSANWKSGVGVALASPDGEKFQYAIKLNFITTNNEAEYEAVLAGLSIAREMGAKNVKIRSNSQDRHDKNSPGGNVQADALSKMGSGTRPDVQTSAYEVVIQTEPSITPNLDVMETEEKSTGPEWATDVVQYLRDGSLPRDKLLSHKVKTHSARYVLIGGVLYRRGYTEPLLKCLTNSEAEYVLKEIHEGVCGNHSGSRMLAHKAMRALANNEQGLRQASSTMRQVSKEVDIVGPMPLGKGRRKFFLVAVDYFTKWAEAEAFATITTANVIKFLWSSVVCRFGIPHAFVTDNGKQFDCGPFRKWCAELQI
ncbi:uncharacterized protein LOC133856706 [Alnus glutinosa]|uniref:uncharacterized protein LOC133856706 n=1 Tax=Alnus glutinosa TaxID=3517 RepID=UPI002D7847E0|nr:uncharacterized protein LOC133856706 [Alnus glutinosa]